MYMAKIITACGSQGSETGSETVDGHCEWGMNEDLTE